jgi:hypothetical protein
MYNDVHKVTARNKWRVEKKKVVYMRYVRQVLYIIWLDPYLK